MPIAGLAADLTDVKREHTGSEHSHYYRNYFGRTKEPKWNRFSVPYRFYGEIDPDKVASAILKKAIPQSRAADL